MGRAKKKQTLGEFYKEKTKGIGLENIVLLKIVFHSLPQDIKEKLKNFQSFWKTKQLQEQYRNKTPIYIIEHDEYLNKELNNLIEIICKRTQLPKNLYAKALTWIILYSRYHKAPVTNFLHTRKKNSIILEIFRKPKSDDWDMMKTQVELESGNMPRLYNVRIDPRHAETIDDRLKTSHAGSFYDVLDTIYGEKEVDKLSKKALKKAGQNVRKNRERFKKLGNKILET